MKELLVVTLWMPEYDKFAGHLRLFHLLSMLASRYRVSLFCSELLDTDYCSTHPDIDHYIESLANIGVTLKRDTWSNVIRQSRYQVVLFEFYHAARQFLGDVRIWQPAAKIAVDTVDVHLRRLAAKCEITGSDIDRKEAAIVKQQELSSYAAADVVIAVGESDEQFLLREDSTLSVEVIPLIYNIPSAINVPVEAKSLLFIGNFQHDPNVDAIQYFCSDVFPLIRKERPDVRFKIIGSGLPSDLLRAVVSENIDVLGYVKDLEPYLLSSSVSVAPIRYGAGMNGKIGEAMSYGLPVVTTSIGSDGFGFVAGRDALVADNPQDFAAATLRLIEDPELHKRIAWNGRQFITQHYSKEALFPLISTVFKRIERCSSKKISFMETFGPRLKFKFDRYIGWRFKFYFA